MDFLTRAENFARANGDEEWFKNNLYTDFREYNNVNDSVWKTLAYLYGAEIANQLEAEQE
jgi:hypothetical protein